MKIYYCPGVEKAKMTYIIFNVWKRYWFAIYLHKGQEMMILTRLK